MSLLRGAAVFAVIFAGTAHASVDTIGPNGINSDGLRDATGALLTGDGIAIGQVEPGRPGVPGMDSPINVNSFVTPEDVFVQTIPAGVDENTRPHAVQVAGVMISTAIATPLLPSTPRGVATGAELYSASDGGTAPDFDPETAISAQHLAALPDAGIRAINMSLVNPLVGATLPMEISC